jgi:hypothetical protein
MRQGMFLLARGYMFCFCSQVDRRGRAMRRIDREGVIVLAFGWLVALAVTLT